MTDHGTAGAQPAPALRDEALRLIGSAAQRGVLLRVTGSIAIELLCPGERELLARLGRRTLRDIDFMAYTRDQPALEGLFTEEGWTGDPVIERSKEWGIGRLIYTHPTTGHKVDVFLDRLVMSHTIDFRGRLELAEPTIPIVDLLLSKLQIHEITPNDLLDLIALLDAHALGDDEAGMIDLGRLLAITQGDWGFERTITLNLAQLRATLDQLDDVPADVRAKVVARTLELDRAIADQRKSRQWRLRAAVGTRVQWYQDVDEVERGA